MMLSGMDKDGWASFESCFGRPTTMNSDLDGFKDKRLADIQFATAWMVFCRVSMVEVKDEGEKVRYNCVSSA